MTNKRHRTHRPSVRSDKAKPARRGMNEVLKDLNELGYLPCYEPQREVDTLDEVERLDQKPPRSLADDP